MKQSTLFSWNKRGSDDQTSLSLSPAEASEPSLSNAHPNGTKKRSGTPSKEPHGKKSKMDIPDAKDLQQYSSPSRGKGDEKTKTTLKDKSNTSTVKRSHAQGKKGNTHSKASGKKMKKSLQPSIFNKFSKTRSNPVPFQSTSAQGQKAKETRVRQQALFTQNHSPPKPVSMPIVERIDTRLPAPNVFERIWLYETLVRFDCFGIPKSVLKKLDRFDEWTEDHLHTLFERLLCCLAGVSNVRMAPRHKTYASLFKAYKDTEYDMRKGDAWEAARQTCEAKGILISPLQDVGITFDQQFSQKDSRLDPADTLLAGRSSRGQRAATAAALARVRSLTVAESDFDEDSEDEDVQQDNIDTNYSDEGSVTGLASDGEVDGPLSSLFPQRRSLRTQEAAARRTEEEAAPTPPLTESVKNEEAHNALSNDIIALPSFENRIALLCGLSTLLLQTPDVSDEIMHGVEKVRELEKEDKEESKELLRQQEIEMRVITRKRNDMYRVGKGSNWTEEHEALVKAHELAKISQHVGTHLQMDANKPRSGPLGTDVDGNQYWQLSEFNERMPGDTSGCWSWSLLIFGQYAGELGDNGESQKHFYGTNKVESIADIIAYIRYRQKLRDYQEICEEKRKDNEVLAAQQDALQIDQNGSPKGVTNISSNRKRNRIKGELVQEQDLRRSRTEELVQRLHLVKEYYQWHYEQG